jgi:hypothetical protein
MRTDPDSPWTCVTMMQVRAYIRPRPAKFQTQINHGDYLAPQVDHSLYMGRCLRYGSDLLEPMISRTFRTRMPNSSLER